MIDRDKFEPELSLLFGRELRRQSQLITRYLKEHGIEPPPEEFWTGETTRMMGSVSPALTEVYVAAALTIMESQPIGMEIGLLTNSAAEWSRNYSFKLVKGINATSQKYLQREIGYALEQGLGVGDITARLATTYGPVRAEMIAITETTRAGIQGQRAFISELEALGVRMQSYWLTARDEIVAKCPICFPLEGVERKGGMYLNPDSGISYDGPPAHPRCRCDEIFEPVTVNA